MAPAQPTGTRNSVTSMPATSSITTYPGIGLGRSAARRRCRSTTPITMTHDDRGGLRKRRRRQRDTRAAGRRRSRRCRARRARSRRRAPSRCASAERRCERSTGSGADNARACESIVEAPVIVAEERRAAGRGPPGHASTSQATVRLSARPRSSELVRIRGDDFDADRHLAQRLAARREGHEIADILDDQKRDQRSLRQQPELRDRRGRRSAS